MLTCFTNVVLIPLGAIITQINEDENFFLGAVAVIAVIGVALSWL